MTSAGIGSTTPGNAGSTSKVVGNTSPQSGAVSQSPMEAARRAYEAQFEHLRKMYTEAQINMELDRARVIREAMDATEKQYQRQVMGFTAQQQINAFKAGTPLGRR